MKIKFTPTGLRKLANYYNWKHCYYNDNNVLVKTLADKTIKETDWEPVTNDQIHGFLEDTHHELYQSTNVLVF